MSINLVLKVLFYGWPVSEICLAIFTRTHKSGGKLRDRGSMLILWGTIFASIFAAEWQPDRANSLARSSLAGLGNLVSDGRGVDCSLDGDSLAG